VRKPLVIALVEAILGPLIDPLINDGLGAGTPLLAHSVRVHTSAGN